MLESYWWAIQGSNLELSGYEPEDLPIDLMARKRSTARRRVAFLANGHEKGEGVYPSPRI